MGRRRGKVGRRCGGLGEMGLGDEGERKKNEKEKGRKKRMR